LHNFPWHWTRSNTRLRYETFLYFSQVKGISNIALKQEDLM
jgi:hypothetical protein